MRARALRCKPRELTPHDGPRLPQIALAGCGGQSHPGSASVAQPARSRSLRHRSRGIGALPHRERPISARRPRSDVAARCWTARRRTRSHEKNGARAKAGERPESLGSAVEREQQTGPQSATGKLRTEAGTADSGRVTRRTDLAQLAVSPAKTGRGARAFSDCNYQPPGGRRPGSGVVRWNARSRHQAKPGSLAWGFG